MVLATIIRMLTGYSNKGCKIEKRDYGFILTVNLVVYFFYKFGAAPFQ